MKPDTVVILAPKDDVHARVVSNAITARGGRAVIMHAAEFPSVSSISQSFAHGPNRSRVEGDFGVVESEQIAGVWWRRVHTPEIDKAVSDAEARRFCREESWAAFEGWVHGFGRRCINPLMAEQRADTKPFQLRAAVEVGLDVPRTLISNDPDQVREFRAGARGEVIYKILTVTYSQFGETRLLTADAEAKLGCLRHAPAIFQDFIVGRDIRVTLVDDATFAVEMVAPQKGARVDWRLDPSVKTELFNLDPAVVEKLHALRRHLGLRYGAADLKLTPDGRYVFLEINPAGQFLFAEIHAHLPISDRMARALLEPEPGPPPTPPSPIRSLSNESDLAAPPRHRGLIGRA